MESVLTERPPLTEQELRFHLEEYKTLRADLAHEKKSYLDYFLYSVAASGGIAAWLLTHHADLLQYGPVVARFAAAIPLVVTLLAFWTSWAITVTVISVLGEYCAILESRIAIAGLGWETWLHNRPGSLGISRKVLAGWGALLLIDVGLIFVV